VYSAAASTWNNAAAGDTISPTEWNTLLDDIETALNFGTTGATDNRLLRSDGTGGLTIQASALTVLDTGFLGINQSPTRCFDPLVDDASNTSVTYVSRLTHTTSGTPTAGIGVGEEFVVETAAGNNEIGATIEAVTTDVTSTSEDFDLVFKLMAAGAAAAEVARMLSTGEMRLGTAGTNAASVVTVGGTQTLTNKTLTAPVIGAATGTSVSLTDAAQILSATSVPAGGTAGAGYKFSSTSNLGVFFGSGVPTLAAAQGSLYLRTDGSSTSTRLYVNSNGSTTWVAVTTAS
jgi:hypothetical protein